MDDVLSLIAIAASSIGVGGGDDDVASEDVDGFLGLGKMSRFSLDDFFFVVFLAATDGDGDGDNGAAVVAAGRSCGGGMAYYLSSLRRGWSPLTTTVK